MTTIKPLSLEGLTTYSLKDRPSKVSPEDFGRPWTGGRRLRELWTRLPRILAGVRPCREVAAAWVQARRDGRPVLLGMGPHPLKVGLSPVLIDLMSAGTPHRPGCQWRRHRPRHRDRYGGAHLRGCGPGVGLLASSAWPGRPRSSSTAPLPGGAGRGWVWARRWAGGSWRAIFPIRT